MIVIPPTNGKTKHNEPGWWQLAKSCQRRLPELKNVNLTWKWTAIIVFVGSQVLFTIDPPFYVYWFAFSIAMAGILRMKICSPHIRHGAFAIYFLFSLRVYYLAAAVAIAPGIPYNVDWDFNPKCSFYRMSDPGLEYEKDIEALNRYMNRDFTPHDESCIHAFEPVTLSNMSKHNSVGMRFRFLRNYWDNPRMTSPFICIIESDVVCDKAHFETEFLKSKSEISFVQHFCRHEVFEVHNPAVLCAVKTPSTYNSILTSAIQFYMHKRYRRLIQLNKFVTFYRNIFVFQWDEHDGCTKYYPHCKYIHFATPKLESIDEAMKLVSLLDGDTEV